MANILYKTELTIYQEFKYLSPQTDIVIATLYDDDTIILQCDKLRVDIRKGKTKHLTFTGKGSRVQKRLIDRSLDLFFEAMSENKIKHHFFT